MKEHQRLTPLIETAEKERRCFFVSENVERRAVYRRLCRGDLVAPHPYRNLYARTEYWNSLNPAERTMHVIRCIAIQRPASVFAGGSAAMVFGWEQSWTLHHAGNVYMATPFHYGDRRSHGWVKWVYVPSLDAYTMKYSVDGLPHDVLVTSPARTLVDCALLYSFKEALPMFDSALRARAVTKDEVVAVCDGLQFDCGGVFRLLHYADPASENGGESLCRATIIELGFAVPQLQHTFIDPDNLYDNARVDFVWHLPDGRIVVLEYDGARKYVDPAMARRRDYAQVLDDQRRRDAMLQRAGVNEIIHVTYDDVIDGRSLAGWLDRAGVPDLQHLPMYERVNYR